MELVTLYTNAVLFLLAPLAILSFVGAKYARNGMARMMVIVLFVVSTLSVFLLPPEFESYPKAASAEWVNRNVKKATILWGGVNSETKDVVLLLYWKGQETPRLYKMDEFPTKQAKAKFAEQLQNALKLSEKIKAAGGTGKITISYPFLTSKERKAKMKGKGGRFGQPGMQGRSNSRGNFSGQHSEDYDDSVIKVSPPPPPNPPKER